jgi:DNA sulfur modification protein DndB
MNKNRGVPFPSLRGSMGDWTYYVTTMKLADVAKYVKPVDKIHERKELKTWLQREIAPERLKQIADYLKNQSQHFFNAIVVGVYGGEPQWYHVTVADSPSPEAPDVDERTNSAIGLLSLRGDEEIFALDGQHRVEGIRAALQEVTKLSDDEQCVIFVSHKRSKAGRERTRRLFSTLNTYAKPVSKGELVALSEDDAFALVTRKLIDEYPPLPSTLVPLTKTANIPPNNRRCVTTILALYDLVGIIALPKTKDGGRERKKLKVGPAHVEAVQGIYDLARAFWDALRTFVPEILEVTDSNPDDDLASKYRTDDGGHVLFRPVGQKAFASATRIMMDRGTEMSVAVKKLSNTTLSLNSRPWVGVLWNAVGKRVINRNGTLAQNLFLHMVGEQPFPPRYALLKEYRKAVDDLNANLKGIKKNGRVNR